MPRTKFPILYRFYDPNCRHKCPKCNTGLFSTSHEQVDLRVRENRLGTRVVKRFWNCPTLLPAHGNWIRDGR